jgi:hypothetical protein
MPSSGKVRLLPLLALLVVLTGLFFWKGRAKLQALRSMDVKGSIQRQLDSMRPLGPDEIRLPVAAASSASAASAAVAAAPAPAAQASAAPAPAAAQGSAQDAVNKVRANTQQQRANEYLNQ